MIAVLASTVVQTVDSNVPKVWSTLFEDVFNVVQRAIDVPKTLRNAINYLA